MAHPPSPHRAFAITLAVVGLAGLLSACDSDGGADDGGGAGTTTSTPDLTAEEQAEFETAAAFAQCMRDQGLEGLPDPQITGDGFMLIGAPLVFSEEWSAAQEACQHVFGDQPEGAAEGAGWERIVPGGDCQCSDGSEFSFWAREANPQKVVLYLQDGGNCFSAETCAPDSGLYNTKVEEGPGGGGVFDFADERNPFADHSAVFVPYCTGDVHLGNTTTEYGPDLTIQHKGYVNGTAALDHLVATFPAATEVVVIGESAGSVAAPFYAGLASDRLPDARITVLANGSGSYPEAPEINRLFIDAWDLDSVVPAWPENADVTAEQWSVPRLFIQSGRHDPDIAFARVDYAYDERQAIWYPIVGLPVGDLLARLDANEAQIEAAGVRLHSYTAPGDDHRVLTDGPFYDEEVNGEALVDWVTEVDRGGTGRRRALRPTARS